MFGAIVVSMQMAFSAISAQYSISLADVLYLLMKSVRFELLLMFARCSCSVENSGNSDGTWNHWKHWRGAYSAYELCDHTTLLATIIKIGDMLSTSLFSDLPLDM